MINMMVSLAVGGDIWATVEGGEGGSEGRDTQTHFNFDHDDHHHGDDDHDGDNHHRDGYYDGVDEDLKYTE